MRALGTLLIALLFLVLLWQWLSPTTEVRYEVTVAVRDGKRVYSNSGVWSRTNTQYRMLHAIGIPASEDVFQGEAVPIDINGEGLILMLPLGVGRDSSVASSLVIDAFDLKRTGKHGFPESLQRASDLPKGASRRVDCDYARVVKVTAETKRARVRGREASTERNTNWRPQDYANPIMPRGCFVFARISKPRLAQAFETLESNETGPLGGTGLALDRLDVTITDKPVTHRIRRYLPWLDNLGSAEHSTRTQVLPDGSSRYTIGNGLPGEIAYLRRSR